MKRVQLQRTQVNVGATTIDLSAPVVMSIINVTPDSFYPGSRTPQSQEIAARVARAVAEGATILDVGGYSSRPGAADVSPAEETRRLHLALEVIRLEFPQVAVSLDTFRSEVAREIVNSHGPCMLNDITAGEADPAIYQLAAQENLPYIAMHMRGTPKTMQQLTHYDHLIEEVQGYFAEKLSTLQAAGVQQVIVDPGFGFAKTTPQNYELLSQMHTLTQWGVPLLAGISRKGMIYKVLETNPEDALIGTSALHWECLRQGASILRVHDTREAMQVIRLFEYAQAHTAPAFCSC